MKKQSDVIQDQDKSMLLKEGVSPLYINDKRTADSIRRQILLDDFVENLLDAVEMSFFEHERIHKRIRSLREELFLMTEDGGGQNSLDNDALAMCVTKFIKRSGAIRLKLYLLADKLNSNVWYFKIVEAQHRAFLRAYGKKEPRHRIVPKNYFENL